MPLVVKEINHKSVLHKIICIAIVMMPVWLTIPLTMLGLYLEKSIGSSSGALPIFMYSIIPLLGYIPILSVKSIKTAGKVALFIFYYVVSAGVIFIVAWATLLQIGIH